MVFFLRLIKYFKIFIRLENDSNTSKEENKTMNIWESILDMIKTQGVEYIFGLGDTDLQLFAKKTPGIKPINIRYEGSAPFMASAYSRLSGKPGVCSASAGPGVANLVPGVLEAYSGCSPLIVISPVTSQKNEGMGAFQECDQLGMMKPITKWSARIPSAERVPWFIYRAFSIAINGQPGPVFLEFPYDITGKTRTELKKVEKPKYRPVKKIPIQADELLISQALDLILEAQKPILIVGSGAISSGANKELMEFIEILGIPFMTTPGGRGIISEDHPLALGVCGLYRTKVGKEIYSDSDLIISLGSRNEGFQTHDWKDFPNGAGFIQVDISPFEIGRNWVPDVGMVGDVKSVLKQLIDSIENKINIKKDFLEIPRVKEIIKSKKEFESEIEKECKTEDLPIPAKRIVYELNEVFGKDTILVSENGSQDTWSYCFPYYKVLEGSKTIPVAEQTCMGMGVVGAISAKLTMPEKNVVCVTGDGAFQMYMKELPTAAQNNIGCTWIVLNNSALGWIKYNQDRFAGYNTSTFKTQPDFIKWAQACDCHGKKVREPKDIRPALKEALEFNNKGIPVVLDFATGIDMSHFERST